MKFQTTEKVMIDYLIQEALKKVMLTNLRMSKSVSRNDEVDLLAELKIQQRQMKKLELLSQISDMVKEDSDDSPKTVSITFSNTEGVDYKVIERITQDMLITGKQSTGAL